MNMNNYQNISSHFVQYWYNYLIEPLIDLCGWILVEMGSFVFSITKIKCFGHHKIVEKLGYLVKLIFFVSSVVE